MKVRAPHVVLSLLVIVSFACAPPAEQEAPAAEEVVSTEADVEAFHELVRRWDAGLNAKDADAILALYAEDPVMMAPFGPAQVGKEAIRAWLEDLFSQGDLKVTNWPSDVRVAEDWSFSHGTYSLTLTPEGEGEPHEETGKWVALSERQADGSWSMVRNVWNTDSPPPGSPPPPGAEGGEAEEVPAPETAPCVESLEGGDRAFVGAFVAGDVATLVALHSDSGMRLPPGMPAVVGKPALTSFFQSYVDLFEPRDLTVTQQGHGVAGDWGASWGAYEVAFTGRDSGETVPGNGKYIAVGSRHADGCWRTEWVLWNSDNPPPGESS